MAPHSSTLAWKIPWTEEPGRLQSMGSLRVGHDWATFTFHFHALEKEMATHSSVLAWRIPGTEEPGGLSSLGSHRVGHDWSDLAAAAAELEISRRMGNRKFLGILKVICPWKMGRNLIPRYIFIPRTWSYCKRTRLSNRLYFHVCHRQHYLL